MKDRRFIFPILAFALAVVMSFGCSGGGGGNGTGASDPNGGGGNNNGGGNRGGVVEVAKSAESIYPKNGDTNVLLRPEILFKVVGVSKEDGANLKLEMVPVVGGTTSFEPLESIFKFAPSEDMPAGKEYEAKLYYQNNLLTGTKFTVMSSPVILKVSPSPGSSAVPIDTPITVEVTDVAGAERQPEVTISSGGVGLGDWIDSKTMKWKPTSKWSKDTAYNFEVTVRWTDKSLVARETKFKSSFTTAHVGPKTLPYGDKLDYFDTGREVYIDDTGEIFIDGGYTPSYGYYGDLYTNLIRFSPGGNLVAERYYQFKSIARAGSIVPYDGGYYLAGHAIRKAGESYGLFVLDVDQDGNIKDVYYEGNPTDYRFIYKSVMFAGDIYMAGVTGNKATLFRFKRDTKTFEMVWQGAGQSWGELQDLTTDGTNLYFAISAAMNGTTGVWLISYDGSVFKTVWQETWVNKRVHSVAVGKGGKYVCIGGRRIYSSTEWRPWWRCVDTTSSSYSSEFQDQSRKGCGTAIAIDDQNNVLFGGYVQYGDGDKKFAEVYNQSGQLIKTLIDPSKEEFSGKVWDIKLKNGQVYVVGAEAASTNPNVSSEVSMFLSVWKADYSKLFERLYSNERTQDGYATDLFPVSDGIFTLGRNNIEKSGVGGLRIWLDKVGPKGEKLPNYPLKRDVVGDPNIYSIGGSYVVAEKNGTVYLSWYEYLYQNANLLYMRPYIARFGPNGTYNEWKYVQNDDSYDVPAIRLYLSPSNDLYAFGTRNKYAQGSAFQKYAGVIKKYKIAKNGALAEAWTYETPSDWAGAYPWTAYATASDKVVIWGFRYLDAGIGKGVPFRMELSANGEPLNVREFPDLELSTWASFFGRICNDGALEFVALDLAHVGSGDTKPYLIIYDSSTDQVRPVEFDLKKKDAIVGGVVKLGNNAYVTVFYYNEDLTNTGILQGNVWRSLLASFDKEGNIIRVSEPNVGELIYSLAAGGDGIIVSGSIETTDGKLPLLRWFDKNLNSD